MTAPRRPDCPPWCTTDHAKYKVCKSAHEHIRTGADGGSLTAFATRTSSCGDVAHVQATRADGAVWLSASDAAALAGVLDVLADATPAQIRQLAAQVRDAATAIEEADNGQK